MKNIIFKIRKIFYIIDFGKKHPHAQQAFLLSFPLRNLDVVSEDHLGFHSVNPPIIFHSSDHPFLKGGKVNFSFLPRSGESGKLKIGMAVSCKGRSS